MRVFIRARVIYELQLQLNADTCVILWQKLILLWITALYHKMQIHVCEYGHQELTAWNSKLSLKQLKNHHSHIFSPPEYWQVDFWIFKAPPNNLHLHSLLASTEREEYSHKHPAQNFSQGLPGDRNILGLSQHSVLCASLPRFSDYQREK